MFLPAKLSARVLSLGLFVATSLVGQTASTAPLSSESRSLVVSTAKPAQTPPRQSLVGMPLSFEPNRGQADSQTKFLSNNPAYSLSLDSTGARFRFKGREISDSRIVRMDMVNANRAASIAGESQLPGKSEYFPTRDRKSWVTDVPTFERVRYTEIYPGVDVAFYGANNRLEYDFVVKPNADAKAIQMTLSGSDSASLDRDGSLVARIGEGNLRFLKPVVYQMSSDGKTREVVSAAYVLDVAHNEKPGVSFALGDYDHSRELIIDPVVALNYSQLLPSYAGAVAVDASGNTYVTGSNYSNGFYVAKFSPTGAVVYNATIGTGFYEYTNSVAISSSGQAYISGIAYNSNSTLPTSNNAYQPAEAGGNEGFLVVLSANGASVPYATFLSGTDTNPVYAYAVAVDSNGNGYLTGVTQSSTFPVTSGAYQTAFPGNTTGFVTKFNPTATTGAASLVYSTFLGPNNTVLYSIAVDSSANAYVTGGAQSGYPVTAGAFQYNGDYQANGGVYVTKLNPGGTALVYSAYLGYGTGNSIVVEGQTNPGAYVSGTVTGTDFPVTAGAYQTSYAGGFLTKLNSTGSAESYSTFLGGPSSYVAGSSVLPGRLSIPYGCASACPAYVAGWTNTADFPQVNSIQSTPVTNSQSGFLTEIASDGASALFSSYVSGLNMGVIQPNIGNYTGQSPAVAVDSSGNMSFVANIYNTVDFPMTIATSNPQTAFLARISASSSPETFAVPSAISFPGQPVGVSTTIYNNAQTATLYNLSSTAETLGTVQVTPSSVFAESDDCAGKIAAGGHCTVTINFAPNAPSTRSGTITFPSNASNTPTTIAVSGSGYDSPFLQVSPTSLTFATQTVGTTSANQSVTITNIGDQTSPLTVYVSSADYSTLNNCPAQLAPGASCTATVAFTPTQPGERTDTLTITNPGGSYEYVSLNGTAAVAGTSTLAFNQSSLQFNPQVVGTTSGAMAFFLSNTGTAPIVLQAVAASGDFSLTYQGLGSAPVQLNPQQQVQYNVVFAPSAAGPRTGAVTFTDNATGSPQKVTLSGTGLTSTNNVEFYPSSAVNFPDTPTGVTSGVQTIYFENTGTAPINVSRVAPTGPFQITYSSCESATVGGAAPDGLGTAGSCQINVVFTPTAAGTQTGTLSFFDSAPGSPHTVTLTGNGIAATGAITLSPNGLTFSTQPNGTSSAVQYVYFQNPGDSPVTVSAFTFAGANPNDFSFGNSNCGSLPVIVQAGQFNCYVPVTFTPMVAGSRTASLTVNSSAGTSSSTLTGTGVAATQAIGLTPATSMPYGSIVVGQSSSYNTLFVRNTGTQAVTFSADAAITGTNAADFNLSGGCANNGATLAPNAYCGVAVNFAPGAAGARSATLSFKDSAGTQTLALSGTGVTTAANYTVTFSTLTYPNQVEGTTSPTNTYTYFNNNGTSPVTLGNVSITGNFLVPSGDNTCNGATLAAGGSCYVYVSFAPAAAGYLTGTLTFNGTSGTPIAGAPVVALAGYSAAPVYTSYIDPTSENYTGNQVVGTTSSNQIFYLYNTGNLPLTVGTITGTDFGLAGAGAEFSLSSANGGYDGCSGQSIAAGNTCQVNVTFTPNAVGARSGSISFPVTYANNTTATDTATLTGTGVTEKNSAVLTPPNGSFIDQAINTTTPYNVTTYLVNSGNQPFTVGTLSNTNSSEFSTASSVGGSDACSGQTVAAGSSCQVNLRFTPSALGKRTGSLGFPVTFADHSTVTETFAVTGTGVASSNTITISPASVQFSTELQGVTSSAVALTVTNTGNMAITFGTNAITTNAAEFAISSDSCANTRLNATATCSIYFTFKPSSSATGVQAGVLTIADNATGGPHTVALSGTAISASQQIALSQTAVAFGNQPAGSTSSARVVYITNQGDSTVSISSIVLGGTNAADFNITSNNCSSLGGHSGCAVSFQFVPPAGSTGNVSATITETDSASPGTHTISLTGTAAAAGPAVALSPASLSFTSQTVGTTSAAQSFSVTNTGSANLILTSVSSTNAAEFLISLDGCSGTVLTPNQHCLVGVRFAPSLGGTRTGTIQVADNATGSPQAVALTGAGLGNPTVSLTPASLAFSSTNLGATSAGQAITLKNTGTDSLQITSITLTGANSGDFADTKTCTTTLAPAASCVVTVTFKPTASGTRGASLTFTDNANNVPGATQNAALTGTGVAVSTASVAPSSLVFSSTNIGIASAVQTATLTNSGTGPLSISSVALGGTNASDYSQSNNCGATLNSSTSCTISVTFKPTASGTRTANITITDNAGNVTGATQAISLSGTGAGVPSAALSPTVVAFSNTNVGVTAAAQSVMLTNSGTGPLTITGVTISGTNSGDFAQSNTCGTSLAAGATCTVSITFDPAAPGNRSATLTITDNSNNTSGTTQTSALSGTGVGNPVAGVSPGSLTFANTSIGTTTAAQNVVLSNTGTGPLAISNIVIGGTNAADFSQTNTCGSSVAVGASCSISVTFDPSAAGTRSATLHVIDNSGNAGATQNVTLAGSGATPPSAAISPASLSFASQNVGTTSAAQAVTLTNSGTTTLSIASVSFSGANAGEFAQTNSCGSTLAGGGSCNISVTFKPSAAGARTANLVVTDNSGNASGSTQSVSLSGTGVATAAVTLSPTSLTFPSTFVGATSTLPIKITNSGTGTLNVTAITNTGANPSLFTHTSNCGGNAIAPGGSCTAQITFSPTAAGTFTATLNIADNATGSPQLVTVTGTATVQTTVTLSQTSLTFPSTQVGSSSSLPVTVTNSGTTNLTVTLISNTGANPSLFTHTSTCGSGASIAPGSTCSIQVIFTPTAAGSFSATLNIADNATGSPQAVTLSGTATAGPVASLSATSLTFPGTTAGSTSTMSFTITNTGSGTLTVSALSNTGANPTLFTHTSNCGGNPLAAGKSCTVQASFTPTATGSFSASMNLTDNATGSPQSVALSGTGN